MRFPTSYASGVAAFEAAIGGSLCLRMRRLPNDFPALVATSLSRWLGRRELPR